MKYSQIDPVFDIVEQAKYSFVEGTFSLLFF
jgi:hypothetical protein